MTQRVLPSMIAASLACSGVPAVSAQTDVTLELGASQVGPPVGTDAQSARFGVGGVRASHYTLTGSGISASVLFGRTFGDANGGDFLSAAVGASLVETLGNGFTGGVDVRFFGFGVRAPFPYRALAAEGGPMLQYRAGGVSVKAALIAGLGRSRVEPQRAAGAQTVVFEDDLWRVGGTAELLLGSGPVRVGVMGGAHDTPGGRYASGGARVVLGGRWGVAELRADVWDTPLGSETTGGLVFVLPVADWNFRGFVGRSEPDPLTLAEPGSGSGAVLVGRSLYAKELGAGSRRAPYEILGETSSGARVRMRIDLPEGASKVELLGDFTLWDAVPMRRDGDAWWVELDIDEGTHHFGFFVDDEWYVPDDAQDVVPDEWGRVSAILVIEGVG